MNIVIANAFVQRRGLSLLSSTLLFPLSHFYDFEIFLKNGSSGNRKSHNKNLCTILSGIPLVREGREE